VPQSRKVRSLPDGNARDPHIPKVAFTKLSAQLTAVLSKCRLNNPRKMMKEDTIEIVGFHAHIYCDSDSRDAAARVRFRIGSV
jgi:hypothetical protein